jgi:hypothetical protein
VLCTSFRAFVAIYQQLFTAGNSTNLSAWIQLASGEVLERRMAM